MGGDPSRGVFEGKLHTGGDRIELCHSLHRGDKLERRARNLIMRTVQISDGVKEIIEHHVADGTASSEADFVEAAVRRYAEMLDDDADSLIAAANEGIEAIERGAYRSISGPEEQAAFWRDVWARSMRGRKSTKARRQPTRQRSSA
jgi:Arc/MetJ-type ribon-helix-helix transcriptional regulator